MRETLLAEHYKVRVKILKGQHAAPSLTSGLVSVGRDRGHGPASVTVQCTLHSQIHRSLLGEKLSEANRLSKKHFDESQYVRFSVRVEFSTSFPCATSTLGKGKALVGGTRTAAESIDAGVRFSEQQLSTD